MLLQLLSLGGLLVAGYALFRLHWVMVAGWTALLEQLDGCLADEDEAAAARLCDAQPHSIVGPIARMGLMMLHKVPSSQPEAFLALGLAASMVEQNQRVRRTGVLALVGAVPAMALLFGASFSSSWMQLVAFAALSLAVLGVLSAHQIRTKVVPNMVASLVGVLVKHVSDANNATSSTPATDATQG